MCSSRSSFPHCPQPKGCEHSWGTITTTLNIYTHVVDASHRSAIEALERELFPIVPNLSESDDPADPVSAGKAEG